MNKHFQKLIFVLMILIMTSLVVAVDLDVTPQSGTLTLIDNGYPQEISLLLSNYALNETVNVTVVTPNDITLHNSSTFVDYSKSTLKLLVSSASSNYGSKQITFELSNGIVVNYDVEVITVASPPIVLESKPDGMQQNSIVTLKVVTNEDAICKFDTVDRDYNSMSYMFEQTNTLHIETWQLEDGDYSYFVRCIDNESNAMQTSKKINFVVDTKGPNVVYSSPKFTVTKNNVNLQVRTDEDATCRYSTAYTGYEFMTNFEVSDNKDHYRQINTLSAGNHVYYIQCVDEYNNYGDVYEMIFTVNLPPTVSIQLSTPSPVTAGTIGVNVISSEDLKVAPDLTYTLDGGEDIKVPLTGSGSIYSGYMIIDHVNDNMVGEFEVVATDVGDVQGTKITSGNTFVVQTKILPKIKYLTTISQEDGDIELEWYLDKDRSDAKYYNIYRSESSDVTNLDFYESVSTSEFIDRDVEVHKTYYYRIAGVDSAGNVGVLSEIKSATSTDVSKKGLTFDQKQRVTETMDELQSVSSDLSDIYYDIKLDNFKRFNDALEIAKKSIKKDLDELSEMGDEILTDEELESELSDYIVNSINVKENIVSRVNTLDGGMVSVQSTENDVLGLTNEYLKGKRLNDIAQSKIDKYVVENQELSSDLVGQVTLTKYETTKFDGTVDEYSILSIEAYTTNIQASDLVIEIPKSIAGDVNELNFGVTKFTTINRDPIVSIDFSNKDQYKFDVLVEGDISFSDISDIRMILVNKPTSITDALKSDNKVSGNLISSTVNVAKDNIAITLGAMIILGLVAYLMITGNDPRNGFGGISNNNSNAAVPKHTHSKINDTQAMIAELKSSLKK